MTEARVTGATQPRRRDASRTRQRLLAVAGEHFAEHGFDGANLRAIAAEAGVAHNLITRYFGGKAGLFAAATTIELQTELALTGPFETLGVRLAEGIIRRWEHDDSASPLLMMMRSAGTSPEAAEALRRFFTEQAARPLAAYLTRTLGCSEQDAADRAQAVGAMIIGVTTLRHILGRGPIAEADPETLVVWLGEQLQRLVSDPSSSPLVPSIPRAT